MYMYVVRLRVLVIEWRHPPIIYLAFSFVIMVSLSEVR
jgi:hypothetical protein